MDNIARHVEVASSLNVKTLSSIVVLKQMRSAQENVSLALSICVPGNFRARLRPRRWVHPLESAVPIEIREHHFSAGCYP